MAEHDAERAGSEEEREPLPVEGAAVADDDGGGGAAPEAPAAPAAAEPEKPLDEEAAWQAIVAGYGEEPPDPPGARPFRSVEDLAMREDGPLTGPAPDKGLDKKPPKKPDRPLGSSVVFAPGVGPRDYQPADPDGPGGGEDEGHFVPPEPPPLPDADVTTKFGWLGVIGGPLLMLLAVLLSWDMTWWLTTLCVGGFLGGFVTLVARMNPGDDGDDDPGRGAVV
ncbi:hypothetical protein MHW47_12300 [Streptomyces sp. OfavH-34-F]|uniref:hypothetical protein n=1 Tax=Streptomyces sp. OfavH-34-F TaxID=2917760 RepID=UPI001EF3C68F|nr:hypothetical protein [Streptomyces sp. OfavH-34-F]MCG7525218.1 hypothetical protein [Streptomyces sp. OfavH-34-F]